jgi:hypothetical protein
MQQQIPLMNNDDLQNTFKGIEEMEGERIANECRIIVAEYQSISKPIEDWSLIIDLARARLNPNAAEEAWAQANIEVGFRGYKLIEKKGA